MKVAREKGDFELCSEVARFMMGVDPRGGCVEKGRCQAVGFKETRRRIDWSPLMEQASALRTPEEPDVKGKKSRVIER